MTLKEAMFYERVSAGRVRCRLCRVGCLIGDGDRGFCGVRENRGGILYTLVYGRLCAEHTDPVEKKPLFHVLPASSTFSVATVGCNFRCRHCQNFSISQVDRHAPVTGMERTPAEIVSYARSERCASISYTYTEPTIFYEFALDTAERAREAGLKNIFVTNGYIGREALARIAPLLDAANIDLKGFTEGFYRDIAGARLSEVLDSIIEYRRQGVWIELTTLIIPGLNDSDHELRQIAEFIRDYLGCDTPWHVSRFYPSYRLTDIPPTPPETLQRARLIGREAGLRYVYVGNLPDDEGENSCCPDCGTLLIRRRGYRVLDNRLTGGSCPECSAAIPGIWR